MSPQLVRILLFLPFLFIGSTGNPELPKSRSFSVIQMPPFLNVSEGSDVRLNCKVEGNVSKWFVNWKKMEKKINNSSRIFVIKNEMKKSSILILKSTVVADSGIYCCEIGDLRDSQKGSTNVIIWEKPYVAVNQTPQNVSRRVGFNVSIACSFSRVANVSLMKVTWYKDKQELSNPNSEKLRQKVILRLLNVAVEDSGNYVCMIRIGNRTGSGNGTCVHITGREKPSQNANVDGDGRQPGPLPEKTESGIGIPVGTGVAVGTLIFLLLLGVLVWRSKRKRKGASENPLEVEPTVAEEAKKNTLTKQMNDVTYADIRFHKREAQLDTEVVYAEVRLGTKRPEHRDRGTQPTGLH
ncbi:titin-like isoform X4 [Ahaetulla prasina]|uniref:titin-like isoform X4 n=1 Tax=Ahaetulla prasina TaxID=499056 RepID=UPI0026482CAE|nr:titin-like isoform X4 [Ahaetulla prasina]